MANWYVSSANYNATPEWVANTAYTVGQIVRSVGTPTQPYLYFVHRCTTAGTTAATEPSWYPYEGTTTSGTATFTNMSGREAYGWAGAVGNLYSITTSGYSRANPGDRIYIASDHSETHSGASFSLSYSSVWGILSVISVNRAGSFPPVAADILPGATINTTGTGYLMFDAALPYLWQGMRFNVAPATVYFNSSYNKPSYFKDCVFILAKTDGGSTITNNNPGKVIWDNTTLQCGHIGCTIRQGSYGFDFTWLNTPSAIVGATIPTILFSNSSGNQLTFTVRGVDLSALTTTLVGQGSYAFNRVLFDSCRIASGVTRFVDPGAGSPAGESVELVNCFNGTTVVNERYRAAGVLTTDRTTTSNALDSIGSYSFKLVTSSRSDPFVEALDTFFFDVENLATGSPKTATIEIISSLTLKNDDVFMTLEYLGTAGSTLATYVSSKPTSLSSSTLPTSGATWSNPPTTPVKQQVQVTFTPQNAGRVRARVHLCRPSTTIWVNPQLTIT